MSEAEATFEKWWESLPELNPKAEWKQISQRIWLAAWNAREAVPAAKVRDQAEKLEQLLEIAARLVRELLGGE